MKPETTTIKNQIKHSKQNKGAARPPLALPSPGSRGLLISRVRALPHFPARSAPDARQRGSGGPGLSRGCPGRAAAERPGLAPGPALPLPRHCPRGGGSGPASAPLPPAPPFGPGRPPPFSRALSGRRLRRAPPRAPLPARPCPPAPQPGPSAPSPGAAPGRSPPRALRPRPPRCPQLPALRSRRAPRTYFLFWVRALEKPGWRLASTRMEAPGGGGRRAGEAEAAAGRGAASPPEGPAPARPALPPARPAPQSARSGARSGGGATKGAGLSPPRRGAPGIDPPLEPSQGLRRRITEWIRSGKTSEIIESNLLSGFP